MKLNYDKGGKRGWRIAQRDRDIERAARHNVNRGRRPKPKAIVLDYDAVLRRLMAREKK